MIKVLFSVAVQAIPRLITWGKKIYRRRKHKRAEKRAREEFNKALRLDIKAKVPTKEFYNG